VRSISLRYHGKCNRPTLVRGDFLDGLKLRIEVKATAARMIFVSLFPYDSKKQMQSA